MSAAPQRTLHVVGKSMALRYGVLSDDKARDIVQNGISLDALAATMDQSLYAVGDWPAFDLDGQRHFFAIENVHDTGEEIDLCPGTWVLGLYQAFEGQVCAFRLTGEYDPSRLQLVRRHARLGEQSWTMITPFYDGVVATDTGRRRCLFRALFLSNAEGFRVPFPITDIVEGLWNGEHRLYELGGPEDVASA